MRIKQIEVYQATLAYNEPFKIAPEVMTEARNVFVKIITDSSVFGWGESSPEERVTGETAETVIKRLAEIAPNLIGMDPTRIEQITEVMDSIVQVNPGAKAPVDIALHDILGKTSNKPLYILMGGYRTEVLTDITLGIKPPKDMAQEAAVASKHGFQALKVKVGMAPAEDVERIRMIREAVGSEMQIRIDANEGWTPEHAIEILNKISKYDVQFVEQPVSRADVRGLLKVKRCSPIPVMADESVHSPQDASFLIQKEAVDLINIKLMKSGGILRGKKIADVAEAAGVPCMIGCMGESEIAISAGVHLAAGTKNIQYADLDSDLLLRDKIVTSVGCRLKNSLRLMTEVAGLGIKRVDERLLGKPLKIYKQA